MCRERAIADVEALFQESRRCEAIPGQRVDATFALWLCACWSEDATAPLWLLFQRAIDGSIAWCRVSDGIDALDLVNARDTAGDHTSPERILAWLQRREADPWTDPRGGGDTGLLDALRDAVLD